MAPRREAAYSPGHPGLIKGMRRRTADAEARAESHPPGRLAVILLAAVAAFAAWFHAGVPPGCTDPRTLALVRQTFPRHHLPPSTRLEIIRTVAGGPLALRFVCKADADRLRPTGPACRRTPFPARSPTPRG